MAETDKQLDLKKVRDLIDIMVENDLVEVEIADGDSKIHLKRPDSSRQMVTQVPIAASVNALAQQQPPQSTGPSAQDDNLADIKSLMVGTYYSAPSPDSDNFVKPGDSVTPDTVVCVIEAMKVMNEIKAETTGTIEKVLVTNGQAVEFGQVLFKVRTI